MEDWASQFDSASQDAIASSIPDLDSRLLLHGIGCYNAADAAFLEVCKFAGMTEQDCLDMRAGIVKNSLVRRWEDRHPKAEAMDAYNAAHYVGAAQKKIRQAFDAQLALDCEQSLCLEPHTKEGIQNTIKAAACAFGIRSGRSVFANDKPVLVTPVRPNLSLVATLYWPQISPISPDAGLDWQFCLFDGDAEQACAAKIPDPPAIYRLQSLNGVFSGSGYSLRHENTKQVDIITKAMCILMLWFSERFPFASSQ